MKVIRKSQTDKFTNSDTCYGVQYSFDEKVLNIAIITVDGRYPDKGHLVNEIINEVIYVLSGKGGVGVDNEFNELSTGDAIFIKSGERYYLEGRMEVLVPCSPSFYPEQHKEVK